MRLAYLVVINDVDPEHDAVLVGDEIEMCVKDLGFRHVDVEIRTNHHVDNTAEA